jgi:hypothetical protein
MLLTVAVVFLQLKCHHRIAGVLWICIIKADSLIACRAHAVPLPCRATEGLECLFPIWFTQCCHVWFTLAMPHPCHSLTMPFFSRPQHSTAIERQPVGHLPPFGFFQLPSGVPRNCFQKHTNLRCRWPVRNQTTFVQDKEKSGSNPLQNDDLLCCWTSSSDISSYHARADFHEGHGTVRAGQRHGMCELMHGMAGEQRGHGMLCVNRPYVV